MLQRPLGGELGGGETPERGIWAVGVVLVAPRLDNDPCSARVPNFSMFNSSSPGAPSKTRGKRRHAYELLENMLSKGLHEEVTFWHRLVQAWR
jgi:hypothetical protein